MAHRPTRICLTVASALVAAVALPSEVGASDVRVASRTLGEGYSIRVPGEAGTLLTRRRLVQYVNLGVYDILRPTSVGELHRRPEEGQLRIVTSMRLRHDFGQFRRSAQGRGATLLESIDGRQIDLLYGYLEGDSLGRWVDIRAGRQFEYSGLDFYAFDGAWVRARTPAHLAVEVFSGFAVDGSALFGYPAYEFDGTQETPSDLARTPMVGAAASTTALKWVDARVAYRRTFSPAALNRDIALDDGTLGLPGGLDQEIASANLALRLADGRINPFGAMRYNLATARVDDAVAGVQWQMTPRHSLRGQWIRTVPAFDLDSIFNVFSSASFEDLRAVYEVKIGRKWRLASRGQARLFSNEPTAEGATEPPEGATAGYGGGLSALHQRRKFSMRLDGFGLGGEGGLRAGGSVDTRTHVVWDRLALDGRAYGVYYEDELVSARKGYSLALQVGANYRITRGLNLNVVAEEMFSSFLKQSFRVLGVLSAEWGMRAGRR